MSHAERGEVMCCPGVFSTGIKTDEGCVEKSAVKWPINQSMWPCGVTLHCGASCLMEVMKGRQLFSMTRYRDDLMDSVVQDCA